MSQPGPHNQVDEATADLLVKQVTEGLSPDEQRALDVLDSAVASAHLREFERAAAAVVLAAGLEAERLPAGLAQRLALQADEHFSAVAGTRAAVPGAEAPHGEVPMRGAAAAHAASRARPRASAGRGAYGWLAAAACLVLAVLAWNRSPPPAALVGEVAPPAATPAVPPAAPTAAEQREALMAKPGSLKIALAATKDPAAAGVTGDVVWDQATQRGYLHFSGLAPNDPAKHQYQLWIFDGSRDKKYPVDGGVFDVPANTADVVIPIRASLMVRKPAAFAVTLEKPGGVVVSAREHVIVLGAAS